MIRSTRSSSGSLCFSPFLVTVPVLAIVCTTTTAWKLLVHKNEKSPRQRKPKKRIPSTRQQAKVLQPLHIRGITLKNRVIRAAAFGGSKTEELIQTHVEVAKGGVAMTTIAYASVSDNGRTFDSQILLTSPNIVQELSKVTQAVHEAGALISLQLTHAGYFADRKVTGVQQVAPSPCYNPAGIVEWAREMTHEDLERVAQDFANAAIVAQQSGFDAVELHCGHGYLLSQFLSPATNWRTDQYGGSATNRVRYPLEILKRIRQAVPYLLVLVKMNVQDGFSGGMTREDALAYAGAFAPHADALVLSGGFTTRNAFYMLRGRVPLWDMAKAMGWNTLKGISVLLFGKWLVPELEFDECFFYEPALEIVKAVGESCPVCLVGGITSLSSIEGLLDDGFGLVQMARGLIQNPHFVQDILESLPAETTATNTKDLEDIQSNCIHCNECVVSTLNPKHEMKCPVKV